MMVSATLSKKNLDFDRNFNFFFVIILNSILFDDHCVLEIVGMLGPGLDNNFLDSVMGDLDQEDNNLLDEILELDPNMSYEMTTPSEISVQFGGQMTSTPNMTITRGSGGGGGDPMLTQPICNDSTMFGINFIKSETPSPISVKSMQNLTAPNPPALMNNNVENIKPTLSPAPIQPAPQPTILVSSSNYCNIKPAPPRNVLSATTNLSQFQNVKPISIQSGGVSVVPQVVAVQSLPTTVMYTKVQPVTAVSRPSGGKNMNAFQTSGGNTLLFLSDSSQDSKVPIHRVHHHVKGGGPPRVGKRLAHNATEKKYRLSISSGIETLKNLVVGDDAKLQKSAILRKAVDYILALEKQNRDLRRQNAELMKVVKVGSVKDLLVQPSDNFVKPDQGYGGETESTGGYNPMTPPRSDESNASQSPAYVSDNSMPSSPYSNESDSDMGSITSRGMEPHARLTLCVFMFAMVVINPFGSFLNRFSGEGESFEGGIRRNILSTESSGGDSFVGYDLGMDFSWQRLGVSFFVWAFNLLILTLCLIKMLIYGDPVLSANAKTTDEFWKHKKHAEVEYAKGNGSAAYRELNRCLQSFGLFLPTTKRECFIATSWQFLRMCLHRVWIGRYLSRKAGGLFCAADKRTEALTSAKELSLIYHRLNQINLASNMQDSNGLLLSLYAVNMAEASTSVMAPEHLVEIYMTAALRVKHSYPKILQFFSRHYINKAKHESSTLCNKIPTEFQWVLTPYGYRFFVSNSFKYGSPTLSDQPLFSGLGNKIDPMSYVMRTYREHLLEKALQCLVGTGQEKNLNPNNGGCRISDVLQYTQLLMDSIINDSSVTFTSCIADRNCCKDRLAHWWASILSIATYWIMGEKDTAETMIAHIGKLPMELYESNDCLPKAFFVAFKAKRAIMMKSGFKPEIVYTLCNAGTELLAESLKCNKCGNMKGMKMVSLLIVTYKWILRLE